MTESQMFSDWKMMFKLWSMTGYAKYVETKYIPIVVHITQVAFVTLFLQCDYGCNHG